MGVLCSLQERAEANLYSLPERAERVLCSLQERAGFRPAAESLSFAGPNESNQSKGPQTIWPDLLAGKSSPLGVTEQRLPLPRPSARLAASYFFVPGSNRRSFFLARPLGSHERADAVLRRLRVTRTFLACNVKRLTSSSPLTSAQEPSRLPSQAGSASRTNAGLPQRQRSTKPPGERLVEATAVGARCSPVVSPLQSDVCPNRIQALCFGSFHLGPQMKGTRHAGRDRRAAASKTVLSSLPAASKTALGSQPAASKTEPPQHAAASRTAFRRPLRPADPTP